MPQKLHDQTGNRPDLTQVAKDKIIAIGQRAIAGFVGCYNITIEGFHKLLGHTLQTAQEVTKPSSISFSFRLSGNAIVLSENSQEIERISTIGIQGGCFYIIDVKKGQTIKHLAGDGYGARQIRLHTNSNWTAGRDTSILLWYDAENLLWKVIGDALSDQLDKRINFDGIPKTLNAYSSVSGLIISGWEIGDLGNYNVTNEGTASVSISTNNDAVIIGAGTVYGLKISDNSGGLEFEFPLCEGVATSPYVIDIVTGNLYPISGTKTVITQNDYYPTQSYGCETVELDGVEHLISAKIDKTLIY